MSSCEIIPNITHRIPRECIKTCMSKILRTINPSLARSREKGNPVIPQILGDCQANSWYSISTLPHWLKLKTRLICSFWWNMLATADLLSLCSQKYLNSWYISPSAKPCWQGRARAMQSFGEGGRAAMGSQPSGVELQLFSAPGNHPPGNLQPDLGNSCFTKRSVLRVWHRSRRSGSSSSWTVEM